MASGQCFCGQFIYKVTGSFGEVRYCHCSQCRQKSGTAFTANARIDKSQFNLEGPESLITEFEYKTGLFNAFCSTCGSPLYARSSKNPHEIRVRLGGFEGKLEVTITGHVWVSSKSSWCKIEDSIPCYSKACSKP